MPSRYLKQCNTGSYPEIPQLQREKHHYFVINRTQLLVLLSKADNWSFAGTYEIIAVRNTEKAFKINSG